MILTSAGTRAIDSFYKRLNNCDDFELVKIAAKSIYQIVFEKIKDKTVLIICGSGLNGCDGLALAYLLYNSNVNVKVYCQNHESETSSKFYALCKELLTDTLIDAETVIDAYFGIGFHGVFDNATSLLFNEINNKEAYKIAIDVPSGINADNCEATDNAFKADLTIAVCTKKPCHLFYPSKQNCGEVIVAKIPYGNEIFSKAQCNMFEIDNSAYKTLLKPRKDNSFKSSFGKAGLFVGSENYVGASIFASNACAKSGVGMISAFIPNVIYEQFSANSPNAVVFPQKTKNGKISNKKLNIKSNDFTGVLCGCGLGLSKDTENIVKQIAKLDTPVVFDADALTLLSNNLELLKRKFPTVITPHIGEFARLCKLEIFDIQEKRLYYAMKFSEEYRCVVVLKDSVTVIANPDGRTYVLSSPTSALARGGSGDVLAGILCSFLAQGYSDIDSSIIAVSLHNKCAHEVVKSKGVYGSLPQDIIEQIAYELR